MNRKTDGFSLIELMVTVAIAAILMTIAIPSYQSYIERSRHAEAQTALMGLAQAMEQFYAANGCYHGVTINSCTGAVNVTTATAPDEDIYPDEAPLDGDDKFFNLRITAATATSYTIQAVSTSTASCLGYGSDFDTFTLDSTGVKTFRNVNCDGTKDATPRTGCWNTRGC